MKILVVTNMLPVPSRPSYGIFVQEQVEDLRQLGLDVSVLFIDASSRRANYLRGVARLRVACDRVAPDLVHAHYGLTGAVAVTQRSAPVVTTFHGSDSNGSIRWQRSVSWIVARLCTPIFVSDELASSLGCSHGSVIPAAVDLDTFQPIERDEARRALGWRVDQPVALLPGSRLHKVKGAEFFDRVLEEARRSVPNLQGASLEGLTRKQVALHMNAADVIVMTSLFEGSPVAVKESLACLTPVVSVRVGDVERLLAGLPGCAVVQREPTAAAAALEAALEAGRSRPIQLRERVAAYGRPVTARRVVDVYRATLGVRTNRCQ